MNWLGSWLRRYPLSLSCAHNASSSQATTGSTLPLASLLPFLLPSVFLLVNFSCVPSLKYEEQRKRWEEAGGVCGRAECSAEGSAGGKAQCRLGGRAVEEGGGRTGWYNWGWPPGRHGGWAGGTAGGTADGTAGGSAGREAQLAGSLNLNDWDFHVYILAWAVKLNFMH